MAARRTRKKDMPPPKTKRERDARKVARAVGDTLEYRRPEVADEDDRDGVAALPGGVDGDSDTDAHRAQLGFASDADPFGVAVPTGIAQFGSRPSTAPAGFLSRPIKLNEMEPRGAGRPGGGGASRSTPLADASSRLAAIEHRQAQLRQQAASSSSSGAAQGETPHEEEGVHSHHTSDSMVPGREQYRELSRQGPNGERDFAVAGTTHPHNAPHSLDGRRIR